MSRAIFVSMKHRQFLSQYICEVCLNTVQFCSFPVDIGDLLTNKSYFPRESQLIRLLLSSL
jgi:hypothetical protein